EQSAADAPNALTLRHAPEDREPRDHPAEYGVGAVETRLRRVRDEKLAAPRVGPRQRHSHGPRFVAHRVQLVAQHETRPAPAVTPRIAVLHDEIRDHTMPPGAVKVAPIDEREK